MNKIDEIKQALEKATPGPLSARCEEWPGNDNLRHWVETHDDGIGAFVKYDDAHLAANAPEWLQWAVGEIERLRKEIIDQRNLLHEKAYKLAKISEDAYIRELREENERLRDALEETRISIGNAYEFGYLRETDEGDAQKMLDRISQALKGSKA